MTVSRTHQESGRSGRLLSQSIHDVAAFRNRDTPIGIVKPPFWIALLLLIASLAQAAAAKPTLVFGVFPYVTAGKLVESHNPLRAYLESKLRQPVELVTAPDFAEFVSRTANGEYDLILTAPHLGRLAEKRDGYARVVKTAHPVQGVFLARRDSSIRSVADLKGKTIMIAQPPSVVYQMAVDHLQRNGLTPAKDVTVVATRTHNNALYAPYRREADAAATGLMLWSKAEPSARAEQVEIGRTLSVPGFMIMAHPRMPAAKIKCVRALLLDFRNTPEGRAYFEATEFIDFETIDDKTMMSLDPYTRILTDPAT